MSALLSPPSAPKPLPFDHFSPPGASSIMADPAHAPTDSPHVSDPYVIYQLRKPSQRGSAVIPRFVPNTHAPAFSPANYRFARVWTANDSSVVSPSALLHVPRSFEYAGSLGSESSFWSDTSSWVSVSSFRTTPSEARTSLLHSNQNPVSAASFFNNDLENARIQPSYRPSSTRSSDIDSPIRTAFRYPPALSESLSEDAVIDDLLSLNKPQFPQLRNHSTTHNSSRDHSGLHRQQSSHRNNHSSSHHRSATPRSQPTRNNLLPTLTHKRRSLWQWLFCTNKAAMSTTVPSVTISQQAAAVRERIRTVDSSTNTHTSNTQTGGAKSRSSTKPQSKDRIPKADKEFLNRTQRAADAPPAKSKAARRRNPSFEIRRGRPAASTKPGRSMSWNFIPKGLLGRDKENHKETKESKAKKKKSKSKTKDKPRQLPTEEPKETRKLHRIVFQRSSSRKATNAGKDASKDRKRASPKQTERPPSTKSRKEHPKSSQPSSNRSREERSREDPPREDRPREDRPREVLKPLLESMKGAGAPLPKSIVPSLREKQSNKKTSQSQRMRSTDSSDPVTSRISSDLSSTTYGRTNESDSSRSTPIRLRKPHRAPSYELDPAAQGVSSDVSSHISGGAGKTSPAPLQTDQGQDYALLSSPEIRGIDPNIMSGDSPLRTPLFTFPSTSSGSGGYTETQSKTADWNNAPFNDHPTEYPEYTSTFGNFNSTAPELIAIMDPVARAREKNRARSAGGPLSYLMKQHDLEGDVNSQSTGLTSLADESVSTHKTVSVAGDEYQYRSQLPSGLHRHMYGETHRPSKAQEYQDNRSSGSTTGSRPIFQSYAMHPNGTEPPSHTSSGASPKRYHSDWSDPHATDIDVFCQCNCSCVYEEECRRSCELVYGRSPSVSSTPSRHEHQRFNTLPPAIPTNGQNNRGVSTDVYDDSEREPFAFQNGRGMGGIHREASQKTYRRANEVDELPDPESERFYSEAYKPSPADQVGPGSMPGFPRGIAMSPSTSGQEANVRGHPRSSLGKEKTANRRSQDHRSLHHQNSSSHKHGTDGPRAFSPRGGPRNERPAKETDFRHHNGESLNDDGYGSKDGRHRSSARRSGQNSGASEGLPRSGRPRKGRNVSRTNKSSKTSSGRKKKVEESRVAHEWEASRSEGTRQMGNSYVVKRSGLPPSSQAHMPQSNRAGDYERRFGHEYDVEGGFGGEYTEYKHVNGRTRESEPEGRVGGLEMYGTAPMVELEYEKRSGLGHRGYKGETRRGPNMPETVEERPRSNHEHKRHHVSTREGASRSKSRSTHKTNHRSRTPVMGVF